MPATKASVVMRIGRSRSRLRLEDGLERAACPPRAGGSCDRSGGSRSSSRRRRARGCRASRRCRCACLKMSSERSANGHASAAARGGCDRVQPRLELRREHQVHEDEREAEREHEALGHVRRSPCDCPSGCAAVAGRQVPCVDDVLRAPSPTALSPTPGATFADDGDLTRAVEAVDLRRDRSRARAARRRERDAAELRRRHGQRAAAPRRRRGTSRRRARGRRTARRAPRRSRPSARRRGARARSPRRRPGRRGPPRDRDRC